MPQVESQQPESVQRVEQPLALRLNTQQALHDVQLPNVGIRSRAGKLEVAALGLGAGLQVARMKMDGVDEGIYGHVEATLAAYEDYSTQAVSRTGGFSIPSYNEPGKDTYSGEYKGMTLADVNAVGYAYALETGVEGVDATDPALLASVDRAIAYAATNGFAQNVLELLMVSFWRYKLGVETGESVAAFTPEKGQLHSFAAEIEGHLQRLSGISDEALERAKGGVSKAVSTVAPAIPLGGAFDKNAHDVADALRENPEKIAAYFASVFAEALGEGSELSLGGMEAMAYTARELLPQELNIPKGASELDFVQAVGTRMALHNAGRVFNNAETNDRFTRTRKLMDLTAALDREQGKRNPKLSLTYRAESAASARRSAGDKQSPSDSGSTTQ